MKDRLKLLIWITVGFSGLLAIVFLRNGSNENGTATKTTDTAQIKAIAEASTLRPTNLGERIPLMPTNTSGAHGELPSHVTQLAAGARQLRTPNQVDQKPIDPARARTLKKEGHRDFDAALTFIEAIPTPASNQNPVISLKFVVENAGETVLVCPDTWFIESLDGGIVMVSPNDIADLRLQPGFEAAVQFRITDENAVESITSRWRLGADCYRENLMFKAKVAVDMSSLGQAVPRDVTAVRGHQIFTKWLTPVPIAGSGETIFNERQ